jgi:hypothetical protein
MSNFLRKILSMGSQTAPRVADDLVESKALQKRIAEESVEPEVLGKAAPRAAAADDISDAVFEEVTPTTGMDDLPWMSRMDPRLKKYAKVTGVAGAGGAAYSMRGKDKPPVQVPLAPVEPIKAESPKTPEEIKKEAKKTVRTELPKQDGLDSDALLKKLEGEIAKPAEEDEFDIASRRANDNMLMAMLGKAATQIGGGIASLGAGSQVKIDSSGFDDLAKIADRPVTALREKQKFGQAKAELDDDKAMRDPNSQISKMVTGIAQKVGILKPGQSASAMDLKNAGVNLGTLLSTIEAGNARRDAAALAREASSASRMERMEMKAQEGAEKRLDKRKLVTEEIEARKRTINDNIARARKIIEEYGTVEATGPQSELLQGVLDEIAVDTAKLQDPDSVARPAEVQLVRKNLIPEDMLGRMTMTNATAKNILDEFEKRTNERAAIGYKVRGVEQPLTTGNSRTFKSKQTPGSVVTVKSGKKYKIGEDGVTGTEIP